MTEQTLDDEYLAALEKEVAQITRAVEHERWVDQQEQTFYEKNNS